MNETGISFLDELGSELDRVVHAATAEAAVGGRAVVRGRVLPRLHLPRTWGRTALIAAALVLLLAAGAFALGGFSTGVPAVDSLLERAPHSDEGPSFPDFRPGRGEASEPLSIPYGGGDGVALAYLTAQGQICTAKTASPADALVGARGNCYPPAELTRSLHRDGAVCCGSFDAGGGVLVVDGFAAGDATRVVVQGPGEVAVNAKLSRTWTPAGAGAPPLRYFAAVLSGDRWSIPPVPPVEVHLAGGGTHLVRP
jgi:hypothetical protein